MLSNIILIITDKELLMEIINIIKNNIPEEQKLEFKQYVFEDGKFNRLVEIVKII